MKAKVLLLVFGLLVFAAYGQYDKGVNSYLGALLYFGKMKNPTVEFGTPGYYAANGTVYGKVKAPAFNFQISRVKGLGYIFSGTLGAQIAKTKLVNAGVPSAEGLWLEGDFELFCDFKIGLQYTYNNSNGEWYAGFRYFNWYNGGGLRYLYGNNDDAASIGIYGAFKRIGLDLNFGLKQLPGFLVENDWDFIQAELRYVIKYFDEGESKWNMGIRLETSKLTELTKTQALSVFTTVGF